MYSKIIIFSVSAVLIFAGRAAAEDYIDLVKKGNEALTASNYKKAMEFYHQAEAQIPESPALDYNFGGALYLQGNYEETLEKYQKALNTSDPNLEARAQYNLGNTYYRMQDYKKAIESFQETLKSNPDDMDAKYNLELARKMLKENSKPEKQENQDQKEQEQQDQQKKDKQDQGEDEQKKEDSQQKQDQQDQDKKQQQKQSKPDDKKMSKEDAERILNALRDDEQKIQNKQKRQVAIGSYRGKDW